MEYIVRSSRLKSPLKNKHEKKANIDTDETSDTDEPVKLHGNPKRKFYFGKYRLLYEIGRGGYGHVVSVKDTKTKQIYAVKVIRKKVRRSEQLNNEAKINHLIRKKPSPFVVIVHSNFQTNGHLCMVMDLMDNGTLNNHIKAHYFSERKSCYYTSCMLLAIQHLHKLDIVHKDIKPHNMVLDKKGNIKLFDFGLSERHTNYKTPIYCKLGTGNFKAPEYFKDAPILRMVDFWALGVTLHLMLTGKYPAKAAPNSKKLSSQARNLLKRMFKKKQEDRLGWGEFGCEDIMMHNFFKTMDFTDLQNGKVTPPKMKYTPPVQKSPYKLIRSLKSYKDYVDINYDSSDT